MPVGLITNVSSLLLGGLLGGILGKHISSSMKRMLNNVFGICAIAIGINLVVKMDTLAVVVLSVVLGTVAGELLGLENKASALVSKTVPVLLKGKNADSAFVGSFCAVAILFCCSGTGWYGVLNEGFTGDSSLLLAKSVLDFFTAVIFAAVLGRMVACLAAPQMAIYLVLFAVSRLIVPFITPRMLADFSAVGGIIEIATGMRIAGINRETRVLNMIPAMLLVFPINAMWTAWIG